MPGSRTSIPECESFSLPATVPGESGVRPRRSAVRNSWRSPSRWKSCPRRSRKSSKIKRCLGQSAKMTAEVDNQEDSTQRMSRILVADDDPLSLRVLQKALERWGHEVAPAKDGTEAWQILTR